MWQKECQQFITLSLRKTNKIFQIGIFGAVIAKTLNIENYGKHFRQKVWIRQIIMLFLSLDAKSTALLSIKHILEKVKNIWAKITEQLTKTPKINWIITKLQSRSLLRKKWDSNSSLLQFYFIRWTGFIKIRVFLSKQLKFLPNLGKQLVSSC